MTDKPTHEHDTGREDMIQAELGKEVVFSLSDGLAWIRLGPPTEKLAVLSESKMRSLDFALDECRRVNGLRALVITGSSPAGFCAGADINAIEALTKPAEGEKLAAHGQAIFAKIEALPVPTLALIWGACVGGGCELALACNYRIGVNWTVAGLASSSPEGASSSGEAKVKIKIGLPEIKLGILPGFGGTQRLPEVMGLPGALDIILKGKTLDGDRALKGGLLDSLITVDSSGTPTEQIERAVATIREALLARSIAKPFHLPWTQRLLTNTALGRALVARQATKALRKETKGRYPAPERALSVTLFGLEQKSQGHDRARGYAEEARALGELVVSPESKALVHIFKASEAAGKLGKSASADVRGWKVAVIGSGVMGAGIAGAFVSAGFSVALVDTDERQLERARGQISGILERRKGMSAAERAQYLSNLTASTELEKCRDAHLVVEAIVEDLGVKQVLLQKLEAIVSSTTVIATNTSSLSVAELSSALTSPERFIGLHFFNPAEKMPLVEIVRTSATDEKTLLRGAALVSSLGKFPVIVEDVPGFLVNRILTPYLSEAGALLAEGYSVEQIDRAALNFGMPMGPLRLLDEVGLDVGAKVSEVLFKAYGARMEGPPFVASLNTSGLKGKKSGEGFYCYTNGQEVPNPKLADLIGVRPTKTIAAGDATVEDRLILSMLNEALRCFDDGVAGAPGKEAAAQIDLASVMGTGFAPFRGGVIMHAKRRGLSELHARLQQLKASAPNPSTAARLEPAPVLAAHCGSTHENRTTLSTLE